MSRVSHAAATLLQQFKDKEKYLLEGELLPESIGEAYEVQVAYQGALTKEYGDVAGYKVAYTTTALQQSSGIDEPVAGVILAKNVRQSPAVLNSEEFLQPGIECEVGVRLGKDLPASGAQYDRDGVCRGGGVADDGVRGDRQPPDAGAGHADAAAHHDFVEHPQRGGVCWARPSGTGGAST